MSLFYSFKIAGVEIGLADGAGPNYVLPGTKIELSRENIDGNLATIIVGNSVTSDIIPTVGNEITVSRGIVSSTDRNIFSGNIKKIQNNDNGTITLHCVDPLQKLKYDLFTASYDKNIDPEAGELSEIFKDIAEQGGFTVSRERSGTTSGYITADKYIANNQSRLNRLNLIQKILDWVFFYDYDKFFIRLEPKGFVEYPTTLNVGVEIKNILVWEEDIENMRNKITVEGATQLDTRIDTFNGDTTTVEFELTYEPESIETTVGGVLQTLGITGSSLVFDYTLDKDRKTIIFESGSIPGTGTGNIIVTYTTELPSPVTGQNDTSIGLYGLTQHESFSFDDVRTIDDAETRVTQLLNILSSAENSTVIYTDEYDVQVGNSVPIIDSLNPTKSGTYIVESKIINYTESLDILKIGQPSIDIGNAFQTINERLNLLEGTDRKLGTILRQLIALVRTKTQVLRKSLVLEKRNMTNSFIIGHQTLGRLRSGFDMEADCSDNTNHGTWEGTDVTLGTQFETSSESGGVISTPVHRLGCGVFNGTDHKITSTVSETGIQSIAFYMINDTNSRDVIELASGKYISTDGSGNVTTTGLTTVTIEETALSTPTRTFVYIEFDAITVTNPTAGYSSTYFDGKLDEIMIFDTTLSASDKTDIQANWFYNNHSKFGNCKLWWSFDNPLLGDRRTAYIEKIFVRYTQFVTSLGSNFVTSDGKNLKV